LYASSIIVNIAITTAITININIKKI